MENPKFTLFKDDTRFTAKIVKSWNPIAYEISSVKIPYYRDNLFIDKNDAVDVHSQVYLIVKWYWAQKSERWVKAEKVEVI